jgi:hypothetical protein
MILNDNEIYLYYYKKKKILKIKDKNTILDDLYFSRARPANVKELQSFKNPSETYNEIKKRLSSLTNKIILYDVYRENVFLFHQDKIVEKIIYEEYRFPEKSIIEDIKTLLNDKNKNRKAEFMLDFLSYFDIDELYKIYVDLFNSLTVKIYGSIISGCKKRSFVPNMNVNANPYYRKDEMIALAKNFGVFSEDAKFEYLCEEVRKREISAKEIMKHQKYIMDINKSGLLQYYTLQGSDRINSYLRKDDGYKDKLLENIIFQINEIIKNAPEFEQDYYFYRFVDDDYIEKYVGKVFMDKGFMSSTHDAFFKPFEHIGKKGEYFGKIVLRIKVPKKTRGVALCVETISILKMEQEILFPAFSKFNVKEVEHYNYPEKKNIKYKKCYDLEWIGCDDVVINKTKTCKKKVFNIVKINKANDYRDKYEVKTKEMIEEEKTRKFDLIEHINKFRKEYVNENDQFVLKLGEKKFQCYCEYYDEHSAYVQFGEELLGFEGNKFMLIYCIYEDIVLFSVEIGFHEKEPLILYYTQYTRSIENEKKINKIFTENDILLLLSNLGYYFRAVYIKLRCDNYECSNVKNANIRIYDDHFYKYFKYGTKKYDNISVCPEFLYDDLNLLKKISPSKVLSEDDNDELYQIYMMEYKENNDDNIASFYCWLVENVCHMTVYLINKMERYYKYNFENPFINSDYVLYANLYLHDNNIVKF